MYIPDREWDAIIMDAVNLSCLLEDESMHIVIGKSGYTIILAFLCTILNTEDSKIPRKRRTKHQIKIGNNKRKIAN